MNNVTHSVTLQKILCLKLRSILSLLSYKLRAIFPEILNTIAPHVTIWLTKYNIYDARIIIPLRSLKNRQTIMLTTRLMLNSPQDLNTIPGKKRFVLQDA